MFFAVCLISILVIFAICYPPLVYMWFTTKFNDMYDEDSVKSVLITVAILSPLIIAVCATTIGNIYYGCYKRSNSNKTREKDRKEFMEMGEIR
jgi:predicted Na+-dependent transporter